MYVVTIKNQTGLVTQLRLGVENTVLRMVEWAQELGYAVCVELRPTTDRDERSTDELNRAQYMLWEATKTS
jgi:hypothetical protein